MKKITKNGLYKIGIDAYHGQPCDGPSISSSGIRTIFSRSPAHYWATSSLNPERIEEPEKAAFVLGRAAHHLLLGEDDFSTLFVSRPDKFDSWRTNAAKEWRAEQEAEGRTVLLPSELDTIRGMAHSLARHPLIEAGILNGEIEQSLFWKDKKTGVWLKSRPDAIPNDSGDFADLKTSVSTGFDLDRDIYRLRYDIQAALVGIAARTVLGLEMSSFTFVFVEKTPPFCVEVLTLKSSDLAEAAKDIRTSIDVFAWCWEHDTWFGPGGFQNDARYVHVPDWVREQAETRRNFLLHEITPATEPVTELA